MNTTYSPYVYRRRTFRIDRPVNQDVQILVLIEHEWNEDANGNVTESRSRHLTEDGWVEHSGYQVYDTAHMPHIDGIDMVNQQWWDAKVTELEKHLAELLGAAS